MLKIFKRKRKGHWEVYKDISGGFRWRLIASNGRIVASSGESFVTRHDCYKSIDSVKFNAKQAKIVEK